MRYFIFTVGQLAGLTYQVLLPQDFKLEPLLGQGENLPGAIDFIKPMRYFIFTVIGWTIGQVLLLKDFKNGTNIGTRQKSVRRN